MSANLVLILVIWKVSRIQSSVFLITMFLLRKNIWQRNYRKPLCKLKSLLLKRKVYTSHCNFGKKLSRNTKRRYFNDLEIKKDTDNWRFYWEPKWKSNSDKGKCFFSKAVKWLKILIIPNYMHIESNDGLTETLCLKLPKYCKY